MNYTGKIIVTNKEGIRQQYQWGTVNKLLCEETTGDANFTFGELHYTPREVRGDVPRTVENTDAEPLFGIAFMCHIDRSCHAHEFSHQPGTGNTLHYHGIDKWVEPLRQEFVEAMYLIEGPGNIASTDPDNIKVEDYEIEEGSAVYHPLNTLHRQYHPGGVDHANFWIHAGYYYGPRDDQPPEYSTCPTSPPGSENAK